MGLSMNISEFNPTHTLVIRRDSSDLNSEIFITNEIIRLYSDRDHSVHICLLEDQLESDYPDILREIQQDFDQSEDSGCYVGTFSNCENSLMRLLAIQTWHRSISLASLTILEGEEPVLHYVPDHNVFEVDLASTPEIEEQVDSITKGKSACLLPKTTLAEWESGGTIYAITPPSLCINNTCFQLSKLQHISTNEDDLSISLSWSTTDQRGAELIGRVFDLLGSSRPSVLEFHDWETFKSASRELSMITEEFEN